MGDLNTTPRTWGTEPGGIVTSAHLNAEVRDAMLQLQAPWVDYTAAWTAATTNPAIVDGTIDASYHRVGKTVSFLVKITMGASTTYGAGNWRISLPFPAAVTRWRVPVDMLVGSSAYAGTALAATSTYVSLWAPATTAGNPDRAVGAASPATFVSGSVVTVAGTYETT